MEGGKRRHVDLVGTVHLTRLTLSRGDCISFHGPGLDSLEFRIQGELESTERENIHKHTQRFRRHRQMSDIITLMKEETQ